MCEGAYVDKQDAGNFGKILRSFHCSGEIEGLSLSHVDWVNPQDPRGSYHLTIRPERGEGSHLITGDFCTIRCNSPEERRAIRWQVLNSVRTAGMDCQVERSAMEVDVSNGPKRWDAFKTVPLED